MTRWSDALAAAMRDMFAAGELDIPPRLRFPACPRDLALRLVQPAMRDEPGLLPGAASTVVERVQVEAIMQHMKGNH